MDQGKTAVMQNTRHRNCVKLNGLLEELQNSQQQLPSIACLVELKNILTGSKDKKVQLFHSGRAKTLASLATTTKDTGEMKEILNVFLCLSYSFGVNDKELQVCWDENAQVLASAFFELLEKHREDKMIVILIGCLLQNILAESAVWRREAIERGVLQVIYSVLLGKDLCKRGIRHFSCLVNLLLAEESPELQNIPLPVIKRVVEITVTEQEHVANEVLELIFGAIKHSSSICLQFIEQAKALQNSQESFVQALVKCANRQFGECQKQLLSSCALALFSKSGHLKDNAFILERIAIPALLSIVAAEEHLGEVEFTQQAKAAITFAFVVTEDEQLQKVAALNSAVPKLRKLLQRVSNAQAEEAVVVCKENALLALASLGAQREEIRRKISECSILLSFVVEFLSDEREEIRAAASLCLRSLSRSPKALRTCLGELEVAKPLVCLLQDTNERVRAAASASLCNLVLDFSILKKSILQEGAVKHLVKLCDCFFEKNESIRINAMWALKNIVYQAEASLKKTVLEQIGKKRIFTCIKANDSSNELKVEALNLIRNVACNTVDEIEFALNFFGANDLLDVFCMILQPCSAMATDARLMEQAIYSLVNILTGNERHKGLLCSEKRLGFLTHLRDSLLRHPNPNIRRGCIWILMNMTWQDSPNHQARIVFLNGLSFQKAIKELICNEDDVTVMDIANSLLSVLDSC